MAGLWGEGGIVAFPWVGETLWVRRTPEGIVPSLEADRSYTVLGMKKGEDTSSAEIEREEAPE